jgi:copper chaperone CopZ
VSKLYPKFSGYQTQTLPLPMKKTYTITGMTCDGCANTVKKLLSRVEGVKEARVSLNDKTAEITHENVQLSALKIALRGFPYEIVERA